MAKRKRKLDILGKVMSKIARGLKLTPAERKILAGAIDASKKARSEGRKRRRRRR